MVFGNLELFTEKDPIGQIKIIIHRGNVFKSSMFIRSQLDFYVKLKNLSQLLILRHFFSFFLVSLLSYKILLKFGFFVLQLGNHFLHKFSLLIRNLPYINQKYVSTYLDT